jgi:signal transduction histidine kinase
MVADVRDSSSEARLIRTGLELGADEAAPRVESWLGIPLNTQGRTIGLLVLASGQRFFFRAHHAQLALAFANQVAAVVESVRIKEQAVRAAAMTERARLARELHDSVSQALFGVSLGVRTGLELLPPGAEAAQKPIVYALELAEAALLEMRALIFEMRPESLREEGLVKALRRQAEAVIARYKAEYGSKLKLSLCEIEPDVSLDAKEALYRISMEALTNAAKHARATEIELDLTCDDDAVTLLIVDNGAGFDPGASFPGHLGLITMRERTEQFGGSIDIDSATGHGTRITVRLPLSADQMVEHVALSP